MLLVVDYGASNLLSVANAFSKLQVPVQVSSQPLDVTRATRIVLPGVGAFDEGIRNLRSRGLVDMLAERILGDRIPVLGICLGLQMMTRESEEGSERGLGWLPARTVAFDPPMASSLKVPHMGWNGISPVAESQLLRGVIDPSEFYFAHSYHVSADQDSLVVARTQYGVAFPSVVQMENIFGVQFHPEKSWTAGLRLLRNFAELGNPEC